MIDMSNFIYRIKDDFEFIIGAEQKNIDELSKLTGISRNTIYEILDTNKTIMNIKQITG